MKYRALIFDVDGTLYSSKPVQRGMLLRIAGAHLLRPFTGRRLVRGLMAYRRAQEALRGHEPVADLARVQLEHGASESGVSVEELRGWVEHWMETAPLALVAAARRDGIRELLEAARAQGQVLGVVSDYPAQAKLDALGLGQHFDQVGWAQQPDVGCFKPAPRALERMCERLGVGVQEALYIGDRVEVDAAAAASAGMECAILGRDFGNYRELAVRLAAG